MAIRLQSVLPTGYLQGRYIGQNVRLLEDVSFYTKNYNLANILLSIHFKKAFDSLNWIFLFKILENVNLKLYQLCKKYVQWHRIYNFKQWFLR